MNYSKLYNRLTKYYGMVPYSLFHGYAFAPLHIFFESTHRCNLRCSMCQFLPLIRHYNTYPYSKEELTREEIKGIIDQLPRFSLITFTGGEPFLRRDFFDILEYASQRNKCHIITNGTLITEAIAMKLIDKGCENLLQKGLVLIAISLQGREEIHDRIVDRKGAFKKTIEGIKLLVKYRKKKRKLYPLINIPTVMSVDNSGSFSEMVAIAEEVGIDIISFLTMQVLPSWERFEGISIEEINKYPSSSISIDTHQLKREIESVLSMIRKTRVQIRFSPSEAPISDIIRFYDGTANLKDYRCFSPWYKIYITSNGDVVPCINYKFGNLREKSFKEIWNGDKAVRFRKGLKDKLFPVCIGCCMLEHIGRKI